MFWIRNSVAAAVMLAAAGAAGAATLVVRSSGPSAKAYPAGRSLADGTPIALQPGDQLTLLDARGSRVLRGPGSFSPAGAATSPATGTRFAALVGSGSDRRVRIGAVRGPGEKIRRPNIWLVDTTRSGTMCLADASSVTLWRPRPDQDQQVTITGPAGAKAAFAWGSGSNTVPWPASLPVKAGVPYAVAIAGMPATTLTFAMLGGKPAGVEDAAAALQRNGCSGQIDLMVDALPAPDTATASAE